jgi:dihydroflavonol-4-reductase
VEIVTVLVTGAEGVLGNSLIRQLVESGFTVRAMLDPKSDAAGLDGLSYERVPGDILDPESTLAALQGVQAVFHCESSGDFWPPRAGRIDAVNLGGTRNLLVSMSRAGTETLVHVGSAFSFGFGTQDEPGTEETPYMADRFHLACFDSMRRAQELVQMYSDEGKIRGIIVNPTFALGPYFSPRCPVGILLSHVGKTPSRYPSGGINVVGAIDAARAMVKALGRGRPGRCYILGGHNVRYKELFERIASALGVPAAAKQWPDKTLAARGLLGSFSGKLTRRAPPLTKEIAQVMTACMYYDSARAIRELDLSVTPLDSIVEEACARFMDKCSQGVEIQGRAK